MRNLFAKPPTRIEIAMFYDMREAAGLGAKVTIIAATPIAELSP